MRYREDDGIEVDDDTALTFEEYCDAKGIDSDLIIGLDCCYREGGEEKYTAAQNAEEYMAVNHLLRYLLADLDEDDAQGRAIDCNRELEQLKELASVKNAEAAYYLAELTDDVDEKATYYEMGIDGLPKGYADKCRKKLKETEAVLEEKGKEERAAEQEHLQREEATDKTKPIIKAGIAVVIIVALIGELIISQNQ